MAKYDINDPTDISIMEYKFSDYTYEDWNNYIEFAKLPAHKNTFRYGDYLIDDRLARGVDKFEGEHIHFGEEGKYKTWEEVVDYLSEKERLI